MHGGSRLTFIFVNTALLRRLAPGAAKGHENILKARPVIRLAEQGFILDLGAQPLVVARPFVPTSDQLGALVGQIADQ
ncbi:MAG: hypothetical protein ACR2QF_00325 [Geminicoccaceae bacterium]